MLRKIALVLTSLALVMIPLSTTASAAVPHTSYPNSECTTKAQFPHYQLCISTGLTDNPSGDWFTSVTFSADPGYAFAGGLAMYQGVDATHPLLKSAYEWEVSAPAGGSVLESFVTAHPFFYWGYMDRNNGSEYTCGFADDSCGKPIEDHGA